MSVEIYKMFLGLRIGHVDIESQPQLLFVENNGVFGVSTNRAATNISGYMDGERGSAQPKWIKYDLSEPEQSIDLKRDRFQGYRIVHRG